MSALARLGGRPIGHGRVADTLGADGGPVEALVLMEEPALPDSDVTGRPVAVLHVSAGSHHTEELVRASGSEAFADLEDATDLSRWHAEPAAWEETLARLTPGQAPHVTGCGTRGEAEHVLARPACLLPAHRTHGVRDHYARKAGPGQSFPPGRQHARRHGRA
ncbi:inorganic diphosphatase [Streptomyces sp. TS71-3]|uniref:inorganic diphosphatase n=1 Tax=Streptomyces sp. TS71-3 TaxID=2733862 RepID=UPI0035ABEB2C